MKKLFIIVLVLGVAVTFTEPFWGPKTVSAQNSGLCDRTTAISIAAGMTGTVAAASPNTVVYICGYDLSADTLATTAAFESAGAVLIPAMRFCDECNHIAVSTGVLFQGPAGGEITIDTVTGAVTGLVSWCRGM